MTKPGTGHALTLACIAFSGVTRMVMSSPTEQLVEDAAGAYFIALGASTTTGAEIDDAGERADSQRIANGSA